MSNNYAYTGETADQANSKLTSDKGLNKKLFVKKDSIQSIDNNYMLTDAIKKNSKSSIISGEFKTVNISKKLKRQLTGSKGMMKVVQMHNRNRSTISEAGAQDEDAAKHTSETNTINGDMEGEDKDGKKSRFSLNTDSILKLEAFQQRFSANNGGSKRNSANKNISALKKEFLDSNGLLEFTYEMTNKMLELESVNDRLKESIKTHKHHNSKLISELQDVKSKYLVAISDIEVLKMKEFNDGAYIEELNQEREEVERLKQEMSNLEMQFEEKIAYIKFQEKKCITERQELLEKIEKLNAKVTDMTAVEKENLLLKRNLTQSFRKTDNDEIGFLNQQMQQLRKEIDELKKEKQKLQRKAEVNSTEFAKKEEMIKELTKENARIKAEFAKQKETKEADRIRKNSFNFLEDTGKEKLAKDKTENLISLKETLIAHKRFSVKNIDLPKLNAKDKDPKFRAAKRNQTVKQLKFNNLNLIQTQTNFISENNAENNLSKTSIKNNDGEDLYFQQSSQRSSTSSSRSVSEGVKLLSNIHESLIDGQDENILNTFIKIKGSQTHRVMSNANKLLDNDDSTSNKGGDQFNFGDQEADHSLVLDDITMHRRVYSNSKVNTKLSQYLMPCLKKDKSKVIGATSCNLSSNFVDDSLKNNLNIDSKPKDYEEQRKEKLALDERIARLSIELDSQRKLENTQQLRLTDLEQNLKEMILSNQMKEAKERLLEERVKSVEVDNEKLTNNLHQAKDLINQLLAEKQNVVNMHQEYTIKNQEELRLLRQVNDEITNSVNSKVLELNRLSSNIANLNANIPRKKLEYDLPDKCQACFELQRQADLLQSEIAELQISKEQLKLAQTKSKYDFENKLKEIEEQHNSEKLRFCKDYDDISNCLYEVSTKFKLLQKEFVNQSLS